jgi:hypothetical protein
MINAFSHFQFSRVKEPLSNLVVMLRQSAVVVLGIESFFRMAYSWNSCNIAPTKEANPGCSIQMEDYQFDNCSE